MFFLYRTITTVFFPILILIIYVRKFLGKEDNKRYKEKISIKLSRLQKNQTIWFHGASIGEIMSIIPLIEYLIKKDNSQKILITSVTLSSGQIIEKKFSNNKNIYHHYLPLDVSHLTKKFLDECIACGTCHQIFSLQQNELSALCGGCNKFLHCGHERIFSTIFYPSNRPSYTLWDYL